MERLIQKEVQAFINKHLNSDVRDVALSKNPFQDVPWTEILNQIKSKKKAAKKIPTWYQQPGIVYPPSLSLEQASSELTAQFKSSIINGGTLLDITGGMGIDDYFISKSVDEVIYCEIQEAVFTTTQHNLNVLGANNITCKLGNGIDILTNIDKVIEHIYIDPARRDESKNKVFLLEDCTPNIIEHLDLFSAKAKNLWIKTSPLLDLSHTIAALKNVKSCYIISVNNEVKELLWHINWQENNKQTQLHIVELNTNKPTKIWSQAFPDTAQTSIGAISKFLYVPSAGMFKSGLFNSISQSFQIDKLHPSTHLYTSDKLIDFDGRTFEIETVIPYNKNNFKQFQGLQLNVSTRNFPESPELLIKKHKLKDGGPLYGFFTTNMHQEKILIIAHKINKEHY